MELPNLHLLRAQEASARVACVRLPPQQVFVTFLTQRGPPLIYSGIELKYGDVIMHSRGEHGHQRTTSATRWGSISVTLAALLQFGESVAGYGLVPPASFCLLRPLPAARQQLLRVHSQAGRIAETNLDRLSHKEIVRALEQELILALITCLTTGQVLQDHAVKRDQAAVLLKLEAMLAAQPYKLLHTQDICRTIGVSEHILQASCSSVLGMSADSYQRLLRLKRVRRELTKPAVPREWTALMSSGAMGSRTFTVLSRNIGMPMARCRQSRRAIPSSISLMWRFPNCVAAAGASSWGSHQRRTAESVE